MQDLNNVQIKVSVHVMDEILFERDWGEEQAYEDLGTKIGQVISEHRQDLVKKEPTAFGFTIYTARLFVFSSEQLHELVKKEARIMFDDIGD